MANTSGGLHDKIQEGKSSLSREMTRTRSTRLGSLSKSDSIPNKKDTTKEETTCKAASETVETNESLIQRCVIIQRDERGYGLTVSGDNPVFVQSVKPDGAAARAGVQEGDRIIKVNGTLVTQSNHQEVVKLIKSGSYVALTLLGKSPGQIGVRTNAAPPISLPAHSPVAVMQNNSRLSSSSERITGPQPVDPEKQQEVTNLRIHTIKKMYEKEVVFLENLQAENMANPTDLIHRQILSATKRVKVLEEQLVNLTGVHPDHTTPRSPRSPPMLRQCHSETIRSHGSGHNQGKHLTHQTSAPTLPKSDRSPSSIPSPNEDGWFGQMGPPPVPASHPPIHHGKTAANRNASKDNWVTFPAARQISVSTSCENLSKHGNPKSTTWPHVGPTHSRQSSSPEALLHNIHLAQPMALQDGKKLVYSEHSLNRSHSELGQHQPRKMSASDALSETEHNTKGSKRWRPGNLPNRGSSFRHFDRTSESPHGSPPPTPPLPNFDFSQSTEGMESEGIDVDEYNVPEEAACYPARKSYSLHDLSDYKGKLLDANEHPMEAVSPVFGVQRELGFLSSTPELKEAQYGTPPEEQSSPTSSLNTRNFILKPSQTPFIVGMEDDEMSSDSESHMDDHGPFNSLWKLLKNQAHLAVFMQYLLLNRSPASMFFYLIANIYEEGTGKEMKKWAYEIHSSFLVPGAPLRVTNIDQAILNEIDDVLQNHLEREDLLRSLFRKAKKKARELLNSLLAEFRNKRSIGLGNIYGPNDYRLEEAIHDKNKELRIIEQVLVPSMEKISDDPDTMCDEEIALASSLATVLKQFGVKCPQAISFYDRWPSFVAKEKTRLKFLQRNKKSMSVQNHQFVPQHYFSVTYCNHVHCQNIIWGVGNQGYQCQHCEMNIHKACVKVVEESCIGAFRGKKDKKRDRMSGIMENIIGKSRKPSHPNVSAIERAKRLNEEAQNMDSNNHNAHENTHITDGGDKSNSGSRIDKLRERFEAGIEDHMASGIHPGLADSIEKSHSGKKGTSIGRSESFRQRRESRPSFRKRSDPNIPRSKSDVEVDDKSNLNNSGSSSNSSLSARYEGSLDSPSNSQEMVHRTPSTLTAESISSTGAVTTGVNSTLNHHYDDSDLEAEADPPNWQDNVDWEVIKLMKPKEKKRQDVINELFHTERTHVRNLKILERMFYRPMQMDQLLPADQLQLLFPNLEEMVDIHGSFNNIMKSQKKEGPVIGNIGETMLQMLDGTSGESLKKAAAMFCKNQSVALECLKSRQRKDQKLGMFLAEAEAHNMCRRLQLKDIIVTGFQRLTKYPLLLENVAKYTTASSEEHANLLRAVECSRQILAHVNQAVKEAENHHRLNELQKNLEKTSFVKADHPVVHQYRNIDFTQHRMVYEGPLTWKLNKQKSIEVHVVLLEDILVLLLKQDEKFVLKFQNINITTSKEDAKLLHCPILKVMNLFPRNVATDKRGFFLVTTSDQHHAIYEFAAASAAERKIWLRHITEAIEAYKTQNGQSKIPEPSILSDRTESAEDNEDGDSRVKDNSLQDGSTDAGDSIDNNDGAVNLEMSPQDSSDSTTSGASQAQPVTPSAPPPSPPPLPDKPVSPALSPLKDQEDQENRLQQKGMQRVEIFKIADGPQLIEPYEVVVRPSAILQTAEPVLTPVERLKRKDMQIAAALAEKEELVARILQVPKEEFENCYEISDDNDGEKDVPELLLAAIHDANRLSKLLNEKLRVTEEDAISATSIEDVRNSPSPKISRKYGLLVGSTSTSLRSISASLNKHLTQLLSTVSEREQERKQLRKELHSSREQIHQMHETHRYCSVRSRSPSSSGNLSNSHHSRPNSFVSIGSSTSEGVVEMIAASAEDLALISAPISSLVSDDLGFHESGIHYPSVVDSRPSTAVCVTNEPTCTNHQPEENPTLTGSQTSEESTTEMFVDAPGTLLPLDDGCPVTDLDSDSNHSCSSEERDESTAVPSEASGAEETPKESDFEELQNQSESKKDSDASCAKDVVLEQNEPELVVNPIYF